MKYDNSPYPRPDYLKEIESRLDSLVRNAYKNRVSDPESSMNNARRAAEAVCQCTILKHQLTKQDNVPRDLDAMLNILRKNTQAMPRNIELHTETLQKWGNAGSHFHTTSLTPDDIASALLALKCLVEWFYEENGLDKASSPDPFDKPEADPPEKPDFPFRIRRVSQLYAISEPFESEKSPEPEEGCAPARRVATNFYLDLSFTKDRGSITFRSPDTLFKDSPAYAAVKNSCFFDFDELFSAITDMIALLLDLDPDDILIHYKEPGEWQPCAPEFLYDDEDSEDTASIPFDVSYHKSTKNKRTEDFAMHITSYMIEDESLHLYFAKKPLPFILNEKKLLSYYGLNLPALRQAASRLVRLAHPTHYANVNPSFTLHDGTDNSLYRYKDAVQFDLGYTLGADARTDEYPAIIDMRLRDALYERDDARASLLDTSSQREKFSRWAIIAVIFNIIAVMALILFQGDVILQSLAGTAICIFLLFLAFQLFWS